MHACRGRSSCQAIDDVLVLRVSGGADHFFSITGSWVRSPFCTSLEQLVMMPVPSSKLPVGPMTVHVQQPLQMPKEIWQLVDFLITTGLDTENLFLVRGSKEQKMAIRRSLESGSAINPNFDAHSIADTLLLLLQVGFDRLVVVACSSA